MVARFRSDENKVSKMPEMGATKCSYAMQRFFFCDYLVDGNIHFS